MMSPALAPASTASLASAAASPSEYWANSEESARLRRLRSLLALFGLYAISLFLVAFLSDGADIGCILAGISGHVLYATFRTVSSWRDAAWIESARARVMLRAR